MTEILILDDVLDAAVLMGKILTKSGYTTHTFTEEAEAVQFAKENRIDLAILDIKLKKVSGIEVLTILKQIWPHVRVIMLTGYPTVETARESLRRGADEYCVKPIDRGELEAKVAAILKEDDTRRQ